MSVVLKRYSRQWVLLAVLLISLCLLYGFVGGFTETQTSRPITESITLGGVSFDLEVPQTPDAYKLGLMHRAQLPERGGMLFRFTPPQVVHFWMKECLMPLDIVFLRDGAIRKIQASAPPCRESPCPVYSSDSPVDMVIELKAGTAQKLGLQVKQHGESK
jgi:uncharacterized protein